MPALGSLTLINAPLEAVFDLAQDIDLRLRWDPFLKEARYLNGAASIKTGTRVWFRNSVGLQMTVEFFGVTRPAVVGMKMVRGPKVFSQFLANWQFRAIDAENTEVTCKYVFESRWRIIGWLIDPVIISLVRRDNRKRLAGLKKGAEQMGLIEQMGARHP